MLVLLVVPSVTMTMKVQLISGLPPGPGAWTRP
jgi:hypothetical protein